MKPFADEVAEILTHYHDVARAHGMDRALHEAVEAQVFTRRECAGLQRKSAQLEAERDALRKKLQSLKLAARELFDAAVEMENAIDLDCETGRDEEACPSCAKHDLCDAFEDLVLAVNQTEDVLRALDGDNDVPS